MAKLLTSLFAFRLDAWEALLSDASALEAARDRLLARQDLMPEERPDAEAFFREAIQRGHFYEALAPRSMRKLDRWLVDLFRHELSLDPLLPDTGSHRYEWVGAFMERNGIDATARRVFENLVSGRRFGRVAPIPEDLPYYGYLRTPEAAVVASVLPAVLAAMEDERARMTPFPWRRRGYAHDQPYELLRALVPAMSAAADRGADVLAISF
ncbi:MAG: hypothetical protein U0166_03700 [Acidobacteriota bacterium]